MSAGPTPKPYFGYVTQKSLTKLKDKYTRQRVDIIERLRAVEARLSKLEDDDSD